MSPALRITIQPTAEFVHVDGAPCRVWRGVTINGIECRVLVAAVAAQEGSDCSIFERQLTGIENPLAPGVKLV